METQLQYDDNKRLTHIDGMRVIRYVSLSGDALRKMDLSTRLAMDLRMPFALVVVESYNTVPHIAVYARFGGNTYNRTDKYNDFLVQYFLKLLSQ